jgi:Thoeris protein ThsB, TIR-like domain
MPVEKTYDIFITHAWRYHDDWTRLSNLLDAQKGRRWRNFSVPWYDPALDPNTEIGARHIRTWIDGQIRPVMGVVLLDSVYAVKSARKWLDMEIELGRLHRKPVVALPAYGTDSVSVEALALADEAVTWDSGHIISTLERLGNALVIVDGHV